MGTSPKVALWFGTALCIFGICIVSVPLITRKRVQSATETVLTGGKESLPYYDLLVTHPREAIDYLVASVETHGDRSAVLDLTLRIVVDVERRGADELNVAPPTKGGQVSRLDGFPRLLAGEDTEDAISEMVRAMRLWWEAKRGSFSPNWIPW